MRRLLGLILIAAAVAAAAFFADRPGRVEIVWQHWQIETSVGVLLAAAAVAALVLLAALYLLSRLLALPRVARRRRLARRERAGRRAITRGMIALASGEAAAAERQLRRAERYLPDASLTLLLEAQTAQLASDSRGAQRAYAEMLDRPALAVVGLRGLMAQSIEAGEYDAALRLAERARELRPKLGWLPDTLLALQARTGRWEAAAATLAQAAREGRLPADAARHRRGVVLYELSRAAEAAGDTRRAAGLAAKAQALAPDLPAPACRLARLQAARGRAAPAAKTIERAWRANPHPELAAAYLAIRPEAAPLARVAAVQRLAAQNPNAVESRLAVAEAALAAQLWGEARHQLNRAVASMPAGPSRRLCLLMARLEEGEHGDAARARDWFDRAVAAPPEPRYICRSCAAETAEWQSLCPHCGGFDTLSWRVPERRAAAVLAASPLLRALPAQPPPAAPAAPAATDAAGSGPAAGAG